MAALVVGAVVLALPVAAAGELSLASQWGSPGAGDGQFNLIQGVAGDAADNVYVADGNNERIQKFTGSGQFLGAWGSRGSGPGQFNNPGHLAVDRQGNVIVADEGGGRIEKFAPDGTFMAQFGNSGPGRFKGNPRGVGTDSLGNVYVADPAGGRVVKFAPDGSFLTAWDTTPPGARSPGNPVGLAVGPGDEVYVTDFSNQLVAKFSSAGQFLGTIGGPGNGPGQFGEIQNVAVDQTDGHLFVGADFRLQEFTPDGQLVSITTTTGEPPPNDGFRPFGIWVTAGGDVLVTDLSHSRVLRFRQSLPAPTFGKTVDVVAVKGTVLVKLPPSAATAAQTKGTGFVPLTQARSIPVGSQLDVRHGTVRLTSAANTHGTTQTGQFTAGIFEVLQRRTQHGLTDLRLTAGNFLPCHQATGKAQTARTTGHHHLPTRVIRQLRANVKGHFRTSGRYASATVRGTQWDTIDRCDGTLTRVHRGTVIVDDHRTKRRITLHAGKSYLAHAR